MNILFAGSPALAVPPLRAISGTYRVSSVLTNPDSPAGRGRKLTPTPVKAAALDLGIPVLQPRRLDDDAYRSIAALGSDLLVVVAYGKIFPARFLELFPLGGINLHPSLLPKYRGPSPIPAAIRDCCPETGITIQRLARKMDSGDILLQKKLPLTGVETTESLSETVAECGAEMLLCVLAQIERGTLSSLPQDEAQATYCTLLSSDEAEILWEKKASEIAAFIRASNPWPKARTRFGGQPLFLLDAREYSGRFEPPPGAKPGLVAGVDKREGILVQTGEGLLAVRRLQMSGKNPLDWGPFLNGTRNLIGTILGGLE